MKLLRWLKRKKIPLIHAMNGDIIALCVDEVQVVEAKIIAQHQFDEVGLFEAEVEGKKALGGVFMGDKP